MNVVLWNYDKTHRCPSCHTVAIDMEKPRRGVIYTCCKCGTKFSSAPKTAKIEAGIMCSEHSK